MLPMPPNSSWQMIIYAINDRMAPRIDYLQEEVRALQETLTAATGRVPGTGCYAGRYALNPPDDTQPSTHPPDALPLHPHTDRERVLGPLQLKPNNCT